MKLKFNLQRPEETKGLMASGHWSDQIIKSKQDKKFKKLSHRHQQQK